MAGSVWIDGERVSTIPTCHPSRKHVGHGLCRSCFEYKRYNTNRRKVIDRVTEGNLKRLYSLTKQGYFDLLKNQQGVCAICHRENISGYRLAVDHDHKTGKVRGLLCNLCNKAIDRVDNVPNWFLSAQTYLGVFNES